VSFGTAHNISCERLTTRATFFLNSDRSDLQSLAASTLAGDSSLGLLSMEMTDSTMDSTCNELGAGQESLTQQ
jgi:hypothetical protein